MKYKKLTSYQSNVAVVKLRISGIIAKTWYQETPATKKRTPDHRGGARNRYFTPFFKPSRARRGATGGPRPPALPSCPQTTHGGCQVEGRQSNRQATRKRQANNAGIMPAGISDGSRSPAGPDAPQTTQAGCQGDVRTSKRRAKASGGRRGAGNTNKADQGPVRDAPSAQGGPKACEGLAEEPISKKEFSRIKAERRGKKRREKPSDEPRTCHP